MTNSLHLIEDALCRGEVVVASLDGSHVSWRVEAVESLWCNQCGLQSTSPRTKPIKDGLCVPCRDRNERIKTLGKGLAAAVKREDYDEAAKLRDELRIVEGELQ